MAQTPDLKGSSFTLSVLHLADIDVDGNLTFLREKTEQAPAFFAHAPVVINVSQSSKDIDFNTLKSGILDVGMFPVGVTGCRDKRQQTLAVEAGLAVMTASRSGNQAPAPLAPLKIVRTPIRSGQQIYAKDGDLLVLSHVSAGAEVIADGSIHIHGTLRGRAIAGASGQKGAKILCKDLQAELVSIAGTYWLSDQINSEHWKQKVMVSLDNDILHIESLKA
ncbi:septum site-determining protein MinC [Vibrio agarivorans]|uniref:Probable septum site-determining protein MinC n=1 Tax=Vibrio agarivorans TaxID=153622 RepID=A0ABT7XYG3_9VIBR|nr:septum site-determining protein MinC [Vibrio agarivorans]MDN2480821.1 septum site-determining protein MinC [Vibrio agarivorans]